MAAIDDLIDQIEDKTLRECLKMETDRITKEKNFDGISESISLEDLIVVCEFGNPIFPTLIPVDRVEKKLIVLYGIH